MDRETASWEAAALREEPWLVAHGSEDQRMASSISESMAVNVVPCESPE